MLQLGRSLDHDESRMGPRQRDNIYSEENLGQRKSANKWKSDNDEKKVREGKNKEKMYRAKENPQQSGMDNNIHPILESDFSYTFSPIVHGPKWFPTMV